MVFRFAFILAWFAGGLAPLAGQADFVIAGLEQANEALETNPAEAKQVCDSLLALPLSDLERAYVYFTLSDVYYYLEDIRGSAVAAGEAFRVMPAGFPPAKQATLHNVQGQNFDLLGKTDSALWHYQQGVKLAKQLRDSIELSDLYFNIGLVHSAQLQYDRALAHLDSAYRIDVVLQDSLKLSNLLRAIGFMQLRYYDYSSARQQFLASLSYANNEDPAQRCVVLTSLGTLHEQLNETDSVGHYLRLAEACYDEVEDHTTLHYLHKLRGEYLRMSGDTAAAILAFDRSSAVAERIGDTEGRIMATLQSLELQGNNGSPARLEQLLAEAGELRQINVLFRAYELYALQLAATGRFEEALAARDRAAGYVKEFDHLKNQRMVQGQAAHFDLFRKEQQITLARAQLRSQRARWTAILVSILVSLLGGFGYYSYRQKRNELARQRKQLLTETELQRKITEIEGQAFRAQMNPHFIFNALNSVKGLIVTGRDQEAALYISRFSKLVRNILDQSRSKTIALSEELETLEMYLKLEQLRFRDGFDYQLDVSPALDTDHITVPAVIIQPFAENSIWHGFRNSGRANLLSIRISATTDCLSIEIEDNGKGRPPAAAKATTRISHGIDITRARLDNFAAQPELDTVGYTDLVCPNEGRALGTRVDLKLPLRYV